MASRVESARRSVRIARYAIGGLAVAAFAGAAAAARATHPGAHSRHTVAHSASPSGLQLPASFTAAEQQALQGFSEDDGGGSGGSSSGGAAIAPAPTESAPQVQSSGS